jgi:hypothetical protein
MAEIISQLLDNQTAFDRLDVTAVVFKSRLDQLKMNLRNGKYFDGRELIYSFHVIEYQYRGLPHAHLVARLKDAPDISDQNNEDLINLSTVILWLNYHAFYLEADVRRNGRNEARREVTLPWFQEEGSQPSQLGGYRIILFDRLSRDFCATKLWPKFRVDPPNSRDRKPGSMATTLLTVFCFVSACLHRASTQHLE